MLGAGYESSLSNIVIIVTLAKRSTAICPLLPNQFVNLEGHVSNERKYAKRKGSYTNLDATYIGFHVVLRPVSVAFSGAEVGIIVWI